MFPCKLFEILLSPFTQTLYNPSVFVENLALDRYYQIGDLLEQDNKKLMTEVQIIFQQQIPISLTDIMQQYLLPENDRETFLQALTTYINNPQHLNWSIQEKLKLAHSIEDECLLLQLVSAMFKIKITIYELLNDQLESRIINFGHKNNLYLAKFGDGYCLAGSIDHPALKIFNHHNHETQCHILKSEQCQDDPQTPPNVIKYMPQLSNSEPSFNQFENIKQNTFSQELNVSSNTISDFDIAPRYTGNLKFYDDKKKYGFIVMDNDGSDIFVHSDDLIKAGVTKDILISVKQGLIIKFSYSCLSYVGKYNKSRKAVELKLLVTKNNDLSFQYVLKHADQSFLFNQFSSQLQYNYNYNI